MFLIGVYVVNRGIFSVNLDKGLIIAI